MKFKMTPLGRKWVWYDVGNSAFTLLVSTLIPIFFSAVAGSEEKSATVALGYATSIATAVVALLGPVLGAVSDLRGMRRRIFSIALLAARSAARCSVLYSIGYGSSPCSYSLSPRIRSASSFTIPCSAT